MGTRERSDARIWRAIAMGLLVALTWHLGNAALVPRRAIAVTQTLNEPAIVVPADRDDATLAAEVERTNEPAGPAPAPPEAPAPQAVIGRTGGLGAYLRATPRMADRVRAWPDGTSVRLTGEETQAEGRTWLHVIAPDGTLGWMPAEFLLR